MKKYKYFIIFLIMAILFISLQGCATNKPFVKKDLASLAPLKVVRHEIPAFQKDTIGGNLAGFLLLGGLGATIATYAGGKTLKDQLSLPDFSQLMMKKFVERVGKEIPNWPLMVMEEEPIKGDSIPQSNTLLIFNVKDWGVRYRGIGSPQGFWSTTNIKMVDSEGSLIWEKNFTYKSKEFNRNRKLEEFEADNGKLLKEEIEFAAEKTISDFIEHFKEGK